MRRCTRINENRLVLTLVSGLSRLEGDDFPRHLGLFTIVCLLLGDLRFRAFVIAILLVVASDI